VVGCGGVAFFTDFAELKRMYVRDVARGGGAARALLARIEREAREGGFALLRLETGARQAAALRFYRRAGFQPCAAFGAYTTMAPQAVATSVFLQKQLGSSAARGDASARRFGAAALGLRRRTRAPPIGCEAGERQQRELPGDFLHAQAALRIIPFVKPVQHPQQTI
jgi:hypothetical protein